MSSILDVLHQCAERYRENEIIRKRERMNMDTKKRVAAKKNARRKERYDNDGEYHEKILKRQREYDRKHADEKKAERRKVAEEYAKKAEVVDKVRVMPKKPDRHVQHAKEFLDGNKMLYSKPDIIPKDERAECRYPWCMHNVNGNCIHRVCIVEEARKRKNESN